MKIVQYAKIVNNNVINITNFIHKFGKLMRH